MSGKKLIKGLMLTHSWAGLAGVKLVEWKESSLKSKRKRQHQGKLKDTGGFESLMSRCLKWRHEIKGL